MALFFESVAGSNITDFYQHLNNNLCPLFWQISKWKCLCFLFCVCMCSSSLGPLPAARECEGSDLSCSYDCTLLDRPLMVSLQSAGATIQFWGLQFVSLGPLDFSFHVCFSCSFSFSVFSCFLFEVVVPWDRDICSLLLFVSHHFLCGWPSASSLSWKSHRVLALQFSASR